MVLPDRRPGRAVVVVADDLDSLDDILTGFDTDEAQESGPELPDVDLDAPVRDDAAVEDGHTAPFVPPIPGADELRALLGDPDDGVDQRPRRTLLRLVPRPTSRVAAVVALVGCALLVVVFAVAPSRDPAAPPRASAVERTEVEPGRTAPPTLDASPPRPRRRAAPPHRPTARKTPGGRAQSAAASVAPVQSRAVLAAPEPVVPADRRPALAPPPSAAAQEFSFEVRSGGS